MVKTSLRRIGRSLVLGAALQAAIGGPMEAQRQRAPLDPGEALAAATSSVVVHVQGAGGGPLSVISQVRLIAPTNPNGDYRSTDSGGTATFPGLFLGNYTVEVNAPGYQIAREELLLRVSGTSHTFIVMRGEGADDKGPSKGGPPVLVGRARKELDLALAALRDDHAAEASKHVLYALKHAAGNPDVQYVAALCALGKNDVAGAKEHLGTALRSYPDHFGAQTALGQILLQQRNYTDAIAHLEKAVTLDPSSWRGHQSLAEALLRSAPAQAKFHATKALELGKEKAVKTEITLALAEALSGDRSAGRSRLEKFLRDYPQHPDVARARALLGSEFLAASAPVATVLPVTLAPPAAARPSDGVLADVPLSSMRWLPRGIDETVPPVDPGVACGLSQVLAGAAHRAAEFTDALERFSAREKFTHSELDAAGVTQGSYQDSYEYIASLGWPVPDLMVLKELRSGGLSPNRLATPFQTGGLPAIGLVFHPVHAKDFQFNCEGLGYWRGQPAWQIHFEQRADHPARIHDWVVSGRPYPAVLKGRAWIATGSYHLLRVETDLVKPMPEIRLDLHHLSIDYAAVKSRDGKMELWLPSGADVYCRFRGHLFRQEHSFSSFVLFGVDTQQQIKTP